MPSESIITELKLLGQAAYVSGLRAAGQSVYQLEGYQSRAAVSARNLGERMDRLSDSVGRFGAKVAGAAITAGAGLVKIGLNWDAMIERSKIGIASIVHSNQQAEQILKQVQAFALKAPLFGVDQMVKTAQQLIGAGYDAKHIVPYLTTFSDTLSAMGRKPEDLQRLTYAFVQMMSKGQISAEELRGQLGEIFPAQKILARELGMSTLDFAKKMKKGTFKGKEYIMLLLRGMEKDFGGATDMMATTFNGMLANIRESVKFSMGILFKPLFNYLEKDVMPMVQGFGNAWSKVMQDNTLTSEQKWKKTKELAHEWLGTIWDDIKYQFEQIDFGSLLGKALNTAMPVLANAMGGFGAKMVGAFIKGWWESDIWGKLFLTAMFLKYIAGWKAIFGTLGIRLGKVLGKKAAEKAAGEMVAGEQLTLFGNAGEKAGGKWGRRFGAAAMAAFVLTMQPDIQNWMTKNVYDPLRKAVGEKPKKKEGNIWSDIKRDVTHPLKLGQDFWKETGRELDHVRLIGKFLTKPFWSGGHGRELAPAPAPHLQPGQPNFPTYRGVGKYNPYVPAMPIVVHNNLYLDGKIVSKSVAKHNFNERARK